MSHTCSPECRYRRLYEGAQQSLTDMASKQGRSLNRIQRLRGSVVDVLKRTFPREFASAERQLAARLSDVDDETLVAHLDAFLAARRGAAAPEGLEQLRDALEIHGLEVPAGVDLVSWAEMVAATPPHRGDPPAPAVSDLHDLFGPSPDPAPDPEPAPAPDLTAEPASDPGGVPGPVPADGSEGVTPSSGEREDAGADGSGVGESLDALFDELTPDVADLSDLFDAPEGDGDGPVEGGGGSEATAADGSVEQVRGGSGDSDPGERSEDSEESWKDGQVVNGPPFDAAPVTQQTLPTRSVRPEIIDTTQSDMSGSGREKRSGRQSKGATAVSDYDVPGSANGTSAGLDDDTREALAAAVAIPRPMFTSDLVAVAGSAEVVAVWEAECRKDREAPVRFIPAKKRHRQRGALVLPYAQLREAATEFSDTVWAEAMRRYRGADLYEVAVLLHSYGGEVVSHRLGDRTLLLRVNTPRGLEGVVVVLDSDVSPDTQARASLKADVEELSGDRLQLLAVLATKANRVEALAKAVEEDVAARQWRPSFPVAVAQSWEFAHDGGSGAVLVAGS